MRYRHNSDERDRQLERQALQGGPEELDRYYASLYRQGRLESLIVEGEIGSAALWYWKERFLHGYDVIVSVINDSPISEGHPCHGLTYNMVLQHPKNKEMDSCVDNPRYPLGQRIRAIESHYLKPSVKFYDPRHAALGDEHPEYRTKYDYLGNRTPGGYYAESLMSSKILDHLEIPHVGGKMQDYIESSRRRVIGLNFQEGSPSWSIDGPANAQILEVLDYVLDGWIPPVPSPEYQQLLERLLREREQKRPRRNPEEWCSGCRELRRASERRSL